MGDKEVTVDEYNNIRVDNTVFKGSTGLWRLIMMKKPEIFEQEDLENYKELLERTSVIYIFLTKLIRQTDLQVQQNANF